MRFLFWLFIATAVLATVAACMSAYLDLPVRWSHAMWPVIAIFWAFTAEANRRRSC